MCMLVSHNYCMQLDCEKSIIQKRTKLISKVHPSGYVVVPPDVEGCVAVVDSPIGDSLSVGLEGPAAAEGPDI